MAESKSNCSRKTKLSTIENCHQMDVLPLCARLCAHSEISVESNSVQTSKVLWMRL